MRWSVKILWSTDNTLADTILIYCNTRQESYKHALKIYCERNPNRALKVHVGPSKKVK